MYTAEDFITAFEDYVVFNRELYTKVNPVTGILGTLGIGYAPGKDPGHLKFLEEMQGAFEQMAAENPEAETVDAVLDVVFRARYQYSEEQISPYVFSAVEGYAEILIPRLSKEKALELYDQYRKMPMKYRVPVYKKTLAALKSASR